MYIPSYDFGLFEIPYFSELQANEYGAATRFNANTPTSFVDYSLNQLIGLTQPGNARPYSQRNVSMPIIPYELQEFFRQQQSGNITVYPSGTLPPELQHKGAPVTQGAKRMCNPNDNSWAEWTRKLLGICCTQGITADGKECTLHSDDSNVGTTTPSGGRIGDATKEFFGNLPQGAGVFLIGVVIVVLLILFLRR